MATTAQQKRLNFVDLICLDGYRFVYHQAEKINAHSIYDFLWKLRKAHYGKFHVHVIWDNARYHKDDEVSAFAKELGIKLHCLPAYCISLVKHIF